MSRVSGSDQSVFTFEFRPRADQTTTLLHQQGQVEIDAVFVAKRDNKECLFIVEAKHGEKFDSLAKHKLLYPILSLLPKIPSSMPIIPVYLRSLKSANGIDFYIAECSPVTKDNQHLLALDTLSPFKSYAFHLANY